MLLVAIIFDNDTFKDPMQVASHPWLSEHLGLSPAKRRFGVHIRVFEAISPKADGQAEKKDDLCFCRRVRSIDYPAQRI